MFDRVKLLPAVILVLLAVFGLKVFGVWIGVGERISGVSTAIASESSKSDSHEPAKDSKEASSGGHGSDAGTNKSGDQHSASNEAAGASRPNETTPSYLSSSEVDVTNSLSNRRLQLEERNRDLDLREKILVAAEKRLDTKIERLKEIQSQIDTIVTKREEEEEQQILGLVKIYETMKAKDAAKIFEQLDRDVLLSVVERMKPAKMASVMAQMSPETAQEITIALAHRNTMPDVLQDQ